MDNQITDIQTKKKLAHLFFSLLDLLCIWVLWIGYQDCNQIFNEIASKNEIISFGSRDGFLTMGAFIIILHIIMIIEHFFPNFIKKHLKLLNVGAVAGLILFLFSGFYISIWMRSQVENAGYVYCRNASGISALAKTLVYTKNMEICEDLVASKRISRR